MMLVRKTVISLLLMFICLVYGCGVYQYPQCYDQELDMDQVLPRPYIGSFEGLHGDNFKKKNGC